MQEPDNERRERIREALADGQMDALACSLPSNVLMLTGYWPVVGTSIAVATREGKVVLLVPEDEQDLAEKGGADEVRTFQAGSLEDVRGVAERAQGPLSDLLRSLGLERASIGYEAGDTHDPSSYAGQYLYGARMPDLLGSASGSTVPAREVLICLRLVKTAREIERIRTSCAIAGEAYAAGVRALHPGATEAEAAARLRVPLTASGAAHLGVERADGFTFCMSGPNAAEAYAAYQRNRARTMEAFDLVLVHCNSTADGYWTDITRTFSLGAPDGRKLEVLDAMLAARAAALEAIRPGAKACEVDGAARDVLTERGFGPNFKHPTGHGVGFQAIDHNAPPRLHPRSEDVLETGMVFNVEPGLYFEGEMGMRHCDMVALTGAGPELLTPFQTSLDALVLSDEGDETFEI